MLNVNWSQIIDPIQRMFMGGVDPNTGLPIQGIIGGDPIFMAIFLFMFMFILTAVLGLGFLVGSVVIIPTAFLIFQWVPELRIFFAIILGGLLGLMLNKLISNK